MDSIFFIILVVLIVFSIIVSIIIINGRSKKGTNDITNYDKYTDYGEYTGGAPLNHRDRLKLRIKMYDLDNTTRCLIMAKSGLSKFRTTLKKICKDVVADNAGGGASKFTHVCEKEDATQLTRLSQELCEFANTLKKEAIAEHDELIVAITNFTNNNNTTLLTDMINNIQLNQDKEERKKSYIVNATLVLNYIKKILTKLNSNTREIKVDNSNNRLNKLGDAEQNVIDADYDIKNIIDACNQQITNINDMYNDVSTDAKCEFMDINKFLNKYN